METMRTHKSICEEESGGRGRSRHAANLAVAFVLCIAAVWAAMAQPASQAAVSGGGAEGLALTLRSIASELRELHLLVIENRREAVQAEMPRLEHDAAAVQERQSRLREEQSAQTQEMIDLESQMSRPGLTAEQRDELEARRRVLARSPARLVALEAELARNEARVRERMALLDQRLRQLAQRAEQLAPPTR